jgi:hypothetical protein
VTAPQDGLPADGYALGVDLGTSNTVAVVRSPDGRTRPLLFDGQPIMPSVVFVDDTGRIHVGRDAQRLAQLDPARCEPNPKRRIDEPAILLGDREVPVVTLLAAMLSAIAAKAVETVGFLPPAVLTYPAQWGARRRGALTEAVRQAGWPPVRLVPEPVAAARYFAQVMRRPVPVGGAVAVFDFGGGTLDVAVVRNDGDAGFTVVGSGGQEGLGGLDLDAALVGHLGGLVGPRYPEVWEHLSRPVSTTDRRYRRLLWEDVRGAKEMLSRTATAPLPIPGIDQALHLTREEFERLAGPLLVRAVQVAENVIAGTGLRPDTLAGLFLVGGSSRVPLVGRLLHARLGIAPTVLEQPELPVAEGALAELAPPDPNATVLAATPTGPAGPTSPAAPVGLTGPMAPLNESAPPAPTTPWYRRTSVLVSAGAAVLVLVVLAGTVLYLSGYHERGFTALQSVRRYAYPSNGDSSGSRTAYSAVAGNTAYLGVDVGDRFQITARELDSGKQDWQREMGPADDWKYLYVSGDELVVGGTRDGSSGSVSLWVLNRANGHHTWDGSFKDSDDSYWFKGDTLYYRKQSEQERYAVDARTGKTVWHHHEDDTARFYAGFTWDDFDGPNGWSGLPEDGTSDGGALVTVDSDGGVKVLDPGNGDTLESKDNRVDPDGETLVYDGKLFAATSGDGYRLQAFDLKTLDTVGTTFQVDDKSRSLQRLSVCGKHLICALDEKDSDDDTTRLVLFGTDMTTHGSHTVAGADHVTPVGDRMVVSYKKGDDTVSAILNDTGGVVGKPVEGGAASVDDASMLTAPGVAPDGSATGADWTLAGVGAQSGDETQLGPLKAYLGSCGWNDSYLACPEDDQFEIFSFRS